VKKFLYWPYQLYVWLVLFPLAGIFTVFFSICTIIAATLINPHFASRVFAVTWAKCCAWITPVLVEVEGAENAQRHRSYVVASNHQSVYDILVVYGWLRLDLKWVMKAELRKVPALGIGCEKAGHIFVERRNHNQAARAINKALDRLGDGIGILFFPEGTRSPDGKLLPFKKGAFHTAIEQQVPILPVTVTGTRDVMPAKSLGVFPGKVRMVIHPAIETVGLAHNDLGALRQQTREAIASALPQEQG
jgi:1-acyl-sn-glycerol-3-phosphate acyltransferase